MEKNKIFISHRHSDTQSDSFALKTELQKHFGEDNVFLDFKNLIPGTKFAERINNTLKESRVVLVVIGPDWQGPKNEDGVTRLFEEEDWVRREVAAALADPHSHVIPVLVKNAKEPRAKDLPDDLKTLAELQTIEINIKRWEYDVSELVKVLEKFLPKKHNPKAQVTPESQPNPRPFVAPLPQQKSWWAKNYLWVLGGFVGLLILIQLFPDDQEPPNISPKPTTDSIEEIQPERLIQPSSVSGNWKLYVEGEEASVLVFNQNEANVDFEEYNAFGVKIGNGAGNLIGNIIELDYYNSVVDMNGKIIVSSINSGESWAGSVDFSASGGGSGKVEFKRN